MRTQSKETQQHLTPDLAFKILQEGNKRFVNNLKANRNLLQQVNETKEGQYPFATIISCMDSRTSAELVFDQGLGDIFSIRIAGNVLNDDIVGSVEFATHVIGTKLVVVLGHTKCGAIAGACNNVELGKLTPLLDKIKPAIQAEKTTQENRNGSNKDFVDSVAKENVLLTINNLVHQSSIVAEAEKAGKIKIVGGMYNIATGEVEFYQHLA